MRHREPPGDVLPPLLLAASAVRELAAGEKLFEQGDPARAIYRVERGRLRLVRRTIDDHPVLLHTALAGELFAEAALYSDAYHCDAVAAIASRVRVFAKPRLLAALREDADFAAAFTARLARQVQDLRALIELRNIRSARERVLQFLRLRAGPDRQTVPVEGRLQDIAAEIGITREALYRTLAALAAEGMLTRTATGIVLEKSASA